MKTEEKKKEAEQILKFLLLSMFYESGELKSRKRGTHEATR
jgi:hypothetical protein